MSQVIETKGEPFICHICGKPYSEKDRLAAHGEVDCSGWEPEHDYIDEVIPKAGGWTIVHYDCLYKKEEQPVEDGVDTNA